MKKFPSVNLVHTNEIDAVKNCLKLRDNQFNLNLIKDNKNSAAPNYFTHNLF